MWNKWGQIEKLPGWLARRQRQLHRVATAFNLGGSSILFCSPATCFPVPRTLRLSNDP